MTNPNQKQASGCLSDKDIQLIRKTYLKLTELYYENPKDESIISNLIHMGHLVTQVIALKRQADVLSLIPIAESLKVKSKSRPEILEHIDQTVTHLRFPRQNPIKYETLLHCLQQSDLFSVGSTVAIRFYQKIRSHGSQFNWKQIIEELSRNIAISPTLCVELTYLICVESQLLSRYAVKSGLIKYVFLSYISSTLDNKFNLYKAIKLLKVVANAEGTLLREKQRSLALVIFTYEDYVPVIEGIIAKCYDPDYCQGIDNRRKYDINTLDQPYLWSYLEQFCVNNLSEPTIKQLIKRLKEQLNEMLETKIYGILSNYSKYKRIVVKEVLELLPKSQKALLNFIKLCVNCCELDHESSNFINMAKLEGLVDRSPNNKVANLFKYLKQLRNKDVKIGVLSQNYKKMFDMQKNADFMMERAAKVPQNNEQLTDIMQILKEKNRTNEFQSDTLKAVKERALNSLRTAVIHKKKLDLNIILRQVDRGDVSILAQLLETLQLCLVINEDLVESVDVNRVLEIIGWIEDHFNGELIQWASIRQLLMILFGQGQWKKHIKQLPDKCFWLLNIEILTEEEEGLLNDRIAVIANQLGKYGHKVPLLVGFLGKALSLDSRIALFNRFPALFSLLNQNISSSSSPSYKTSLLMLSEFLYSWHSQEQEDQGSNLAFQNDVIPPLVSKVLANFRSLDQEYQLLQRCMPFKFTYDRFRDNLDYLISLFGKLAGYVYLRSQEQGQKAVVSYDRIKAFSSLPLQKRKTIVQILSFLEDNSGMLQADELRALFDRIINNKFAYWLIYPFFYKLIAKMLAILANTSNPVIDISSILIKIILYTLQSSDIAEDEKNGIYLEVKTCLESLAKRHLPIDRDQIRESVLKIPEKDIQQEIVEILQNYTIIYPKKEETGKNKPEEEKQRQKEEDNTQRSELASKIIASFENNHFGQGDNGIPGSFSPELNLQEIQKHDAQTQHEIQLVEALRMLKKIIEKQQTEDKFARLYPVFLGSEIKSQYKDILGHLLALFYPHRQLEVQRQVLELLLNKEKTRLSKQSCYQLLRNNPQTFCLSKRWKLVGRQWLDLAMLRYSQGQVTDGSQVAEVNLGSSSELQYFMSKGYHQLVIKGLHGIASEEDHVPNLLLIGTSARHSPIKLRYYKQKIHSKVIALINLYPNNSKLFANLLYALSSLVYMQPEVCLDIIQQKQELQLIFNRLKEQAQNRSIVESGACLVANLSYSNEEVKEVLRHLNVVETFLFLFETSLEGGQVSTFKQLLRALGNLSLSTKCTQQLIDQHFCSLAVRMTEKIEAFVSLDDKKLALMKILIDLVANLASHRYRLEVFHREGVVDAILTLLETTQNHLPVLTASIDTIDCLCLSSQIQNYVVTEKKIPYLLIDILKIQTDEKIVIKSTRLLTNLTINPACIPHILKANLLSVLANIVMPHFYGNRLAGEQKKKMQTYILKVITRIYHAKPDKETILKSGYLDCLIRTIETTQNIEDSYIEILYFYSEIMPNFLNKRAFICLVKVLTRKIAVREITIKCLRAIKKLSSFYEKDEEDILPIGTAELYEALLTSDLLEEGLQLLSYHLLRSAKLRLLLRSGQSKVLEMVKKLGQNSQYVQFSRQITFLVFNPYYNFEEISEAGHEEEYQQLKKGFRCLLFRLDGSSKKAIIDMNEDYQLRAYKYPDGEIKQKYVIDIKSIKDFQFNYTDDQLWRASLFSLSKSMFDSKKCQPNNCGTLLSSKKCGEINFVNVEFESEAEKIRFYVCLRSVYNSLR